MTTLEAVETALFAYLAPLLQALYPTLTLTFSQEQMAELYGAKKPFVAATLHKHDPVHRGRRHRWELLLQMSQSKYADSALTPEGITAADRELIDVVSDLINLDAGYQALRAAGVYSAHLEGLPEDQRTETMINPHVFECTTIAASA